MRPDIPEITEKTVATIIICIGVSEMSLADAAGISKNAAMSNIPISWAAIAINIARVIKNSSLTKVTLIFSTTAKS
ncbi:MAG: hypothetical protein WBIAU2_05560 [Wolbachia endosymbiont of Drosophila biauraria]|nr:MAG: hypothetical protein WBIAU2_05560 [Wolbachia endosymbiont of Drosophila biauraria]